MRRQGADAGECPAGVVTVPDSYGTVVSRLPLRIAMLIIPRGVRGGGYVTDAVVEGSDELVAGEPPSRARSLGQVIPRSPGTRTKR